MKIPRFYTIISGTFTSKTKRFVVGDVKASRFSVQTRLLCRHITSETSANQHNLTVTYLMNSCGLSPEDAISASKRMVKLQSPERADSVLALLRIHGLSGTQISKLVRSFPKILSASPYKTLLPKLKYYSSLGVSREDLARVLAYNPHLLSRSLEKQIIPAYNFLRSQLPDKNVVHVLKCFSGIFMLNHCKHLVPNTELLRDLGMPQSNISRLLTYYSRVLMLKHEMLGKLVAEVKELGYNLEKSTFVSALRALSGSNGKLKWNRSRQVYRRWGWSEDDVVSASMKCPACMIVSEKKIMQVMEFIVNKMGWPSAVVAKDPLILTLSLEKRIIPRCSVVKVLMLKGLVNETMSLSYVLRPVEKLFVERFVTRYHKEVPQLWNVYKGKVHIQHV